MTATPSRKTRMPSSARAVKVTLPAAKLKRPVQRTEKLSTGRPAGPPAPQPLLMVVSHAVRVAGGVRAMLLKYCAKNWPEVRPAHAGITVTCRARVVCPAGFLTETGTELGAPMPPGSIAAEHAVTL